MSSTEVEIHISKAMPKSKNQVPHPVSGTFCLQAPCSERRETGGSRAYSSHLHGEETLWEMHQVPWGLREEVSLSWERRGGRGTRAQERSGRRSSGQSFRSLRMPRISTLCSCTFKMSCWAGRRTPDQKYPGNKTRRTFSLWHRMTTGRTSRSKKYRKCCRRTYN